ncbi:MAG: hypothetical protein LBH17_05815 [Oscillospiraceae bacterium]|jgi:hypothetical protein|nr:hypothetical protein [Oscillospiraceae bacterium]
MSEFFTDKSASRRFEERGGRVCVSESACQDAGETRSNFSGISGLRRALNVCLIILYTVNILLALLRLLSRSETELPDDGE